MNIIGLRNKDLNERMHLVTEVGEIKEHHKVLKALHDYAIAALTLALEHWDYVIEKAQNPLSGETTTIKQDIEEYNRAQANRLAEFSTFIQGTFPDLCSDSINATMDSCMADFANSGLN